MPQDSLHQPQSIRQWFFALIQRALLQPFLEEEKHSRAQLSQSERGIDWKVIGVFVVAAVSLTLIEYFGKSRYYWHYVHPQPIEGGIGELLKVSFAQDPTGAPPRWWQYSAFNGPLSDPSDPRHQLWQLIYWAGWCVFTYFVIPALFVVVILREKLSDYGLRLKGITRHLWIYGLLLLLMVPIIYGVSSLESFQETYPFFRGARENPVGFWMWQLAYAAQFFSLEFFFRGFMLHGTQKRLGPYAILVMVVPYTMIHFGKPMPETLGAIFAGIALGLLSLRSGSIILGFFIHVSVALSMDFLSLWRQGSLGSVFTKLF